jgi:hypothetical protein
MVSHIYRPDRKERKIDATPIASHRKEHVQGKLDKVAEYKYPSHPFSIAAWVIG